MSERDIQKFEKERPGLAKQLENALTTWDKVVKVVKEKIDGYDKVFFVLRQLKIITDSKEETISGLEIINDIPDCEGFKTRFNFKKYPPRLEYQSFKDHSIFIISGILPPSVEGSQIFMSTLTVNILLNREGRPESVSVLKDISEEIKREDGFEEFRNTHLSYEQELSS